MVENTVGSTARKSTVGNTVIGSTARRKYVYKFVLCQKYTYIQIYFFLQYFLLYFLQYVLVFSIYFFHTVLCIIFVTVFLDKFIYLLSSCSTSYCISYHTTYSIFSCSTSFCISYHISIYSRSTVYQNIAILRGDNFSHRKYCAPWPVLL